MPTEDVQQVVANRGYGGFSISDDTVRWMRDRGCRIAHDLTVKGETHDDGSECSFEESYPRRSDLRACEHLVAAVNQGVASGMRVVDVPAAVEWVITEYDGSETVREAHRTFPGGGLADGVASSREIEEQCRMTDD